MSENNEWDKIKSCRTIVVKVGTSTLTYPNGKLNFQQIDKLAQVLTRLQKGGKKLILVSSGAIAVGSGKMSMKKKPTELSEKQIGRAHV